MLFSKFDPIIIGGTPGSGTRVFCQICKDTGIFMGTNLNRSNDAMEFINFYDKWINDWLTHKVEEKTTMREELQLCVKKHLEDLSSENTGWGFKNPRSIHLLSFFHQIYPQMKFLHVIRDGRDMAYSQGGKLQLEMHAPFIINKKLDEPLDKLHLWNKVNLDAANYGKNKLKKNYLRIRFEDLCSNPTNNIELITQFLDVSKIDLTLIADKIKKPETIGRWKQKDELLGLSKSDMQGLNYFGYY